MITQWKIVQVLPNSPEFEAAIALWRIDSGTLGFMPRGGFEDAAREQTLLAAVRGDGTVAGYVLFRRTQQFAAIAHLCVAREERGKGVARQLFTAVKDRCSREFEIRVRCRRDFDVAALWPKLGFIAAGEEPGRGLNAILTLWRYELVTPPILALLSRTPVRRGAVRIAIDANVFFGLVGGDAQDEQARALGADWLVDFIELAVTEEIFNEIDRRQNHDERHAQRTRASRFPTIPRDVRREEGVLEAVRELLGTTNNPSRESDARQIAMTIAGDLSIFVTCDAGILASADALDREFGLQVMEPHEVVREFDELRRRQDYQPQRLFVGPQIRAAAARSEDLVHLVSLMHNGQAPAEPQRQTVGRLKTYLAHPDTFQTTCIWKGDELLAGYVLERPEADVMRVPFVGVAQSSLARTAARHFVQEIVATAVRENRPVTEVLEAGARIDDALVELGFANVPSDQVWMKLGTASAGGILDAVEFLDGIATRHPKARPIAEPTSALLKQLDTEGPASHAVIAEAERVLWPLKVAGTETPCFIVPIQARWARELFDRELAAGTLFGATPALALNVENVYYRAARPGVLSAPARVLWYVSQEKGTAGTMAIRACSRIDEVVVGRPKELFARFRRLGVYQWRDVFDLADRDIEKDIMAFRFSGTEHFPRFVPREAVQNELLASEGKGNNPFMSPVEISETAFFQIYSRGMGTDGSR